MSDPIIHRDFRDTENHPAVSRTYDDETARLADAPPGGTVAEQLSDGSMWILNSVGDWISLNGGAKPLSNVKIIDQGTAVTVGNDGGSNKPYATVTSGLATLVAGNVTDVKTFLVTPYNYSGSESTINEEIFAGTIAIVSLGQFYQPGVGSYLPTIPVITKTAGGLIFDGVNSIGATCPGALVAYKSTLATASGGNVIVDNTGCAAIQCTDPTGNVISSGCTHNGVITTIGIIVKISAATFISAQVITFTGSQGEVLMDQASYDSALAAGGLTINNGILVLPSGILELSPPILGASQNNYHPDGIDQAEIIFIDASTNINITGIVPPVPGAGPQRKTFLSLSTSTIDFTHEDSGSSANNRFHIPGGTLPMNTDESVTFYYDRTIGRWRAIGLNGF